MNGGIPWEPVTMTMLYNHPATIFINQFLELVFFFLDAGMRSLNDGNFKGCILAEVRPLEVCFVEVNFLEGGC